MFLYCLASISVIPHSADMLILDSLIRFSAVGVLLVLLILLLRDGRKNLQAVCAALLCFSLMGSMVLQAIDPKLTPIPFNLLLVLIVINTNIFFWWFCLSLFEDDFTLGRREWVALLCWFLTGLPLIVRSLGFDFYIMEVEWLRTLVGILIVFHISLIVWQGRAQDLVEPRRAIRVPFMIAANSCLLFIVISESVEQRLGLVSILNSIEAAAILAMAIWGVFWLGRLDVEVLLFNQALPDHESETSQYSSLIAELEHMMEKDQIFLEAGLSVGDLAEKLGVPAHQLRVVINGVMGFRNFSAFLNTYRIAEAKKRLLDSDLSHLPILSIALDVGYSSIATFNRAFARLEEKSPSSYRKNTINSK